jgi:uncharacterized membrane protein YedE/YeeE
VIDPVLLKAFAGGLLIGSGAAVLLLLNGRVAGISGILGEVLLGAVGEGAWRIAFLAGLLLPALAFGLGAVELPRGWYLIVVAGLLVGFGTRVGSGCTSGHGVCGIANLSRRSLVATLIFMGTAMVTVFIVRHGGFT